MSSLNPSSELASYKIQLEQVEAALLLEPDDQDLLDLKNNLNSLIELTSGLAKKEHAPAVNKVKIKKNESAIDIMQQNSKEWLVGENCLAPVSKDGCLREGIIVTMEKSLQQCSVYFESLELTETVKLIKLIRPPMSKEKSTEKNSVIKMTKAEQSKEKSKKLKKMQKKMEKMEQKITSQEIIKNNWLNFYNNSRTGKLGVHNAVKPSTKKFFQAPKK